MPLPPEDAADLIRDAGLAGDTGDPPKPWYHRTTVFGASWIYDPYGKCRGILDFDAAEILLNSVNRDVAS